MFILNYLLHTVSCKEDSRLWITAILRSDKCAKMWPLSLMNLHNKYFIHMYKCTVPDHVKRVITYLTSIFTSRLCSLNQSFAVLSAARSPLVPHRLSREFYCNKPSRQGHFKPLGILKGGIYVCKRSLKLWKAIDVLQSVNPKRPQKILQFT